MYKKNDPLVNSVKAIMEQNEHRRRVETKLCEELGIYSRKELPREHLANYDALLEQRIQEALHSNQQKLDVHEPEKDKLTKHDFKMLRAKKTMKEEEQDSRNPLPPSGAKERIQNKLGTGAKSSVDPSYKHQGPTSSDREEMDKKMEKLDEVSKEKAARYATKAVDDVSHDSFIAGGASQSAKSRGTAMEFDKKSMKRQKGVNLAIKKLSGSAKVNANEDVQLDEKAPKGAKYERMVKHIKDKYKKDGLTDDEKSIAYATAHKAKKMDENLTLDDVMEEIARTLGEAKMRQVMEVRSATPDEDAMSLSGATERPGRSSTPDQDAMSLSGATERPGRPANTNTNTPQQDAMDLNPTAKSSSLAADTARDAALSNATPPPAAAPRPAAPRSAAPRPAAPAARTTMPSTGPIPPPRSAASSNSNDPGTPGTSAARSDDETSGSYFQGERSRQAAASSASRSAPAARTAPRPAPRPAARPATPVRRTQTPSGGGNVRPLAESLTSTINKILKG